MTASRRTDHPQRPVLAALIPHATVIVKTNRSVLLSLRGTVQQPRIHIHPAVLDIPEALPLVAAWTQATHRRTVPELMRILRQVQDRLAVADTAPTERIAHLPTLDGPLDLAREFARMHQTAFADLPRPDVAWARSARRGRTTSIRFGCYHRRNGGQVSLHPRLDRPWIARCFIEHVLHHELCHHRQALAPTPWRETVHSPRFRRWERTYPLHEQALAWQRTALPFLLADTRPPWYAAPTPETSSCVP